jgi:HEAT repeat protein
VGAIERFRSEQDPASLEVLSAALGRVVDPAVEELALELVRRDPDPARRAAAFDLLDRLDPPAATAAVLSALGRESDPALRQAALRALPAPRGTNTEGARPVVAELTRLLASDPDEELRRRSAVLLGEWRTCEGELTPVLEALARDPSAQVRAGCAFACEVAGRRSSPVLEALLAAMESEHEDPLVRANAWSALGALAPLPPRAHEAWLLHAEQRDAAGEAGG